MRGKRRFRTLILDETPPRRQHMRTWRKLRTSAPATHTRQEVA